MKKVEIALACDERYFPGLVGTITSLLVSASTDFSYQFHVLNGGITGDSLTALANILKKFKHDVKLNVINISTTDFDKFPSFFYDSKMAYARLLLPSLLPINKVIYIDTDILVLKDVSLLWEMPLDKHAAVCVETIIGVLKNDCPVYKKLGLDGNAPYFNSGLMVIDLDKFRKDHIAENTFKYLEQYHEYCIFWDQSALNVTLYDKLIWLDSSWNVQAHKEVYNPVKDLAILAGFNINFHFVTPYKPWLSFSIQPEYQMFYTVLNEVNYLLSEPVFIKAKEIYYKKLNLLPILPSYYNFQGYFYKITGKKNKAKQLIKVADHWQYVRRINNLLKQKSRETEDLISKWKERIHSKLITNGKA